MNARRHDQGPAGAQCDGGQSPHCNAAGVQRRNGLRVAADSLHVAADSHIARWHAGRGHAGWAALLGAVAAVLGLTGCNGNAGSPSDRPVVFVSILPQADVVRRIAGSLVDVESMIGRGQAEHQYEPSPRQILRLQNASAYFTIGISPETRIIEQIRHSYPKLAIVDFRRGVPLRKFRADDSAAADVHSDHDHAAGAPDPHIWLDPALLKLQARNVADELAKILPQHKDDFEKNLIAFDNDLTAVDAEIDEALRPYAGRTLLVFHPTLGYFAQRYGLVQRSIEFEGKEPSARQLDTIVALAERLGIHTVFYQPQFPRQSAEAVAAAIHGRAVELDHLPEDIVNGLRIIAKTIATALAADDAENHKGTDGTPARGNAP